MENVGLIALIPWNLQLLSIRSGLCTEVRIHMLLLRKDVEGTAYLKQSWDMKNIQDNSMSDVL